MAHNFNMTRHLTQFYVILKENKSNSTTISTTFTAICLCELQVVKIQ